MARKTKTKTKTVNTVNAAFNRASLVVMGGLLTLGMALGLTAFAVADDTTPGVTITSPADGEVVDRGENINIAAEISPEIVQTGVASLAVSVDGEEICSGGGSDSISCGWKAPNRPDSHTITAVATDVNGEVYSDAATITVACTLRTVNENAQGEAAKTVTICQPTSPAADS